MKMMSVRFAFAIGAVAERGRRATILHMNAKTTATSKTNCFSHLNLFWKKANQFGKLFACLWYRGIVPYSASRRSNAVAIHEASLWTFGNFDEVLANSKLGYSDGTRGVGEVPICIRPTAFGAITFKYGILVGKTHFYDIECCGAKFQANKRCQEPSFGRQ